MRLDKSCGKFATCSSAQKLSRSLKLAKSQRWEKLVQCEKCFDSFAKGRLALEALLIGLAMGKRSAIEFFDSPDEAIPASMQDKFDSIPRCNMVISCSESCSTSAAMCFVRETVPGGTLTIFMGYGCKQSLSNLQARGNALKEGRILT